MEIVFEIKVEDIKRYLVNQTFRVKRDVEKQCFDGCDRVGKYAKYDGSNKIYMSNKGVFTYDTYHDKRKYIAHVTDYSGNSASLRKLQPFVNNDYLEVVVHPQQYWGEDLIMVNVCWFKWECPVLDIKGEYCKDLLVCKKLIDKLTGRDDDPFEILCVEC
jgi:hypothetical protein